MNVRGGGVAESEEKAGAAVGRFRPRRRVRANHLIWNLMLRLLTSSGWEMLMLLTLIQA